MPLIKLQFKPGVNRDQTDYTGEGGWWSCDKIRFLSGSPQKIGGWTKTTPNTFLGVCRQMWNWVTSFSDNMLAIGTNLKLYLEVGGYFYDITPLRATMTTPNTDNCVATDNGSTTVTINLGAPHGGATGDYVTIAGVTGVVGGIPNAEINTNHTITVIDADSFAITVTTAATSTVAAGGGTAITIAFEIAVGNAATVYGYGWGTGTWGRGAWGLGSTQPIVSMQRDWWLDNFDNDLVANIRNGAIYYWVRGVITDPDTALATRAVTLQSIASGGGYDPNAVPVVVMQTLVSQQDKHLIAFGAVPFGSVSSADFDPLLIRWADQDNPGQWEPGVTNSSGFLRISRGSRIVRALPTRQEILVWSDSNLYTLQFTGTSDVFALQEYADNISIVSPRACATASNVTYWMGQDKFYSYTGRVDTLPCTLRNHVFENINYEQSDQIVCGTSEEWNEVWWFYPSADSNWNNKYVILNTFGEPTWYYGDIERTAWLDTPLKLYPQACTTAMGATTGYLYNHEDGVDADGVAMEAYIQSNDFDIGDGDQFMLSRRIIPDVSFNGSTAEEPEVTMELRPRNFPGTASASSAEDTGRVISTTVDNYTNQIFIRARARQMAIKIMSENLGVQWQLGSPRLDVRTDGKR
jgi:hypothetical protein